MQSLQEQVKELCKIAEQVVANPLKTPYETAKELGLSAPMLDVSNGVIFLTSPIMGTLLYAWRKYTESEKRKQEKERMLREIIAKQQAVIRQLDVEVARMNQENAQNRNEVENLKRMLSILEQAQEQIEATA